MNVAMAILNTKPHLKHMLKASLKPAAPTEDISYPVISEFISEHKHLSDRFIIYPQISLRWKPELAYDLWAEVLDFGLENFMLWRPYFKVCLGAEVKWSIEDIMASLPEPETFQTNLEVMTVFHTLFYQGED